jgi:surfeit locus 1 family protein
VTRIRLVVLAVLAIAIAAVCIRLGFWQLDRLDQRRAENARVIAGLRAEPVELTETPIDSTASRAKRIRLRGTYDFENEVVVINRSRDGAPGVNILTPVRMPGRDTAVVVNRGWVYSADGATIDLTQWREPAEAQGTAYLSWLASTTTSAADSTAVAARSPGSLADRRRVSRAEREAIAAMIPYPIAPYQLILLDDAAALDPSSSGGATAGPLGTETIDRTRPIRIPPPALDEGPHRSYAIQWFAFAAIALIGTGSVARAELSRRPRLRAL